MSAAQILIANNGMAGTKAILSMRQWCYLELGDEKAIEFVAMATPEVEKQLFVLFSQCADKLTSAVHFFLY